jgi:HEAT repeat protein
MRNATRRLAYVLIPLLVCASGAMAKDVADLAQALAGQDEDARRAAAIELRDLGAPAAKAVAPLLASEDPAVVSTAGHVLEAIVLRAGRPGAEKERAEIVTLVVPYVKADQPMPARVAATKLLAFIGGDEVLPALTAQFADPDLREYARQAVQRVPGAAATQALIDALPAADPEFRAALIYSLGQRGDRAAVPTLIREAQDGNLAVRTSAIEALGRIAEPAATETVAAAMQKESGPSKALATDAYLRLADAQSAAGEKQEALAMYDRALKAAPTPATRCAAVAGLGRTGSDAALPQLISALSDQSPIVAQAALAALKTTEAKGATDALVASLKTGPAPVRCAVIDVLAARKDSKAVGALVVAAGDKDEAVRIAALGALGRFAAPEAVPVLLKAARSGSDAEKPIALESYLQVADAALAEGKRDDALAMYHRGIQLATGDAERRHALAGIAAIASPQSLPVVRRFLQQGAVRGEAAAAYISIASAMLNTAQRDQGMKLLGDAIRSSEAPRPLANEAAARLRAAGVQTDFAREAGFVTTWWLVGPFPNDNGSAFDKVFFPENEVDLGKDYSMGARTLRWQRLHTDDVRGVVDLRGVFNPADNVAAYGYAEVTVPQAEDAVVKLGTDDGCVLWVNGERVHGRNVSRALTVDEDTVPVHLNAGANRILLKVLQGAGFWEFCLRLTDTQGRPLPFQERTQ